jgi:ATP-binding cassette, subfamily B, multidrug efflux pump
MWWHIDAGDDEKNERQFSNFEVFRRLLPLFQSQKRALFQSLFLLIIVTSASLAGPQILRLTINQAMDQNGNESTILILSSFFIAIALIRFVLNYLMALIIARSGLEMVTALKERLFAHVLKLKVSFFHEYTPGRLLSRVESDTENLKQLFSNAAVRLASSLFMFFGVIAIMLWEDWRSTGVVLLGLPLVGLMLVVAMRILRRYYRHSRKVSAQISGFIAEYVPGISTVQHYGYQDKAQQKLSDLNSELVRANAVGDTLSNTFWGFFYFLEMMAVVAVLAVAAPKVARKELDLGTLIMFIEYLRQVFMPLIQISEFVNFVQRAFVSAERVFALFALDASDGHPQRSATEAQAGLEFQRSVRFENVSFSYIPGDDVLHDIDLEIRKGQTIAVVGPSGGGKSTLANLLLAFYQPHTGKITVDGRPLDSLPRSGWRQCIGLVLQELQLFPGSVRDNLTVFNKDLSDDALWKALDITQGTELVNRLGGLDAALAERGNNLSQGERQLISFARALVHDPQLLILDEATASVDPITERRIQRSFQRMLKSRTAFVIAHRLSTVLGADRILVLEDGRIAASGSHEQLLKSGVSAYQRLYELQFGSPKGGLDG